MYTYNTTSVVPKTTSIKAYRKAKLKYLSRDFKINITEEERKHAESLTTEIQIDQFVLSMLNKYWG